MEPKYPEKLNQFRRNVELITFLRKRIIADAQLDPTEDRNVKRAYNVQLNLFVWGEAFQNAQMLALRKWIRDEIDGKHEIPSEDKFKNVFEYLDTEEKYHLDIEREIFWKPLMEASKVAIREAFETKSQTRKERAAWKRFLREWNKGICWACGRKVEVEYLEIGHIVDRCEGGEDLPSNLAPVCITCNRLKPLHKTKEEALEWREQGGVFGDMLSLFLRKIAESGRE